VLAYVIRRLLYGVAVVLGVLMVLFLLFFTIASPDDIARRALGEKARQSAIDQWKANHGYDRPLWPSLQSPGGLRDNLLVDHYRRMLSFDFGHSDVDGVPIGERLARGAPASLALMIPLFLIETVLAIGVGLFVAVFRGTYIDRAGVFACVLLMSLPILLQIIGAQYLIAKLLAWFPLSGFSWETDVIGRFLALPVLVGVVAGIGSEVRFLRTVFVEETSRDYVRTARAKGASEMRVMLRHVLRNSLIPVLTRVLLTIPFLFTGSLLLEAFFGIPGLGGITVDAINANDFATLRVMVFIGALAFVVTQIVTDVSYALVDPRVRLE
jgi:peptide/nickel transport system permease protein